MVTNLLHTTVQASMLQDNDCCCLLLRLWWHALQLLLRFSASSSPLAGRCLCVQLKKYDKLHAGCLLLLTLQTGMHLMYAADLLSQTARAPQLCMAELQSTSGKLLCFHTSCAASL